MNSWIPAGPFAAALLVGMLVCLEVGRRMGVRDRKGTLDQQVTGLGTVEGAVFGLYALLLAFTFSSATSRFDARRQLIAVEANAIGTAYLRLDLLPPEAQPPLRERFRHYVDTRVDLTRGDKDMAAVQENLSYTASLQSDIWARALAATRLPGAHPDAGKLLLPALNDMIDIVTTRIMGMRSHPPLVIFGLMFVLALMCALLAGYGMAPSEHRRWAHILGFAVITVFSVYLVLEIEYPRRGFIRLDKYDQVLVELRQRLK
jgi:hypothetical protein